MKVHWLVREFGKGMLLGFGLVILALIMGLALGFLWWLGEQFIEAVPVIAVLGIIVVIAGVVWAACKWDECKC